MMPTIEPMSRTICVLLTTNWTLTVSDGGCLWQTRSMTNAQLRAAEIGAAGRFHIRGTAIMTFVIYWLMALTFQDFFFFDPSDATGIFRQTTLWIALFAWLSVALATPLALLYATSGSLLALRIVPYTTLVWPVAIVLAQISAFAETGESYLDYLFEYPIFVLTDIALPVFIIFKWSDMRTAVARAEIDIELRRDKNLPVP